MNRLCLGSCQRALLSLRIDAKITLSILDQCPTAPIIPSYLRQYTLHAYISGVGPIEYAIIELRQFSDTFASIRDITTASGAFLALLNSNDIKLNSLLRRGRSASTSVV